jgi:2-aminoethylphosphonate dioxygenase
MLAPDQKNAWQQKGYIELPAFYPPEKVRQFQLWAAELAALPETKGKWMLYYEQSLQDKRKIVCRIENFIPYHEELRELLLGPSLKNVLEELTGEPPSLFKEKINFKYPGGNGFSPHQDAPAFSLFNQLYHFTIMICIDPCTKENGCIEFAVGRHREGLFLQENNGDLSKDLVMKMEWEPVYANAGDIIVFDSYIPHRSGPNTSDKPRRAIFATYNKLSDLERRDDYFKEKRIHFPPEIERDPLKDYSVANPFNLGNPIK